MIKIKVSTLKKTNIHKILVMMTLICFSCLLNINSVFASKNYSQVAKISLHMSNKSLKQIFSEIEKQSEFTFFYSDNIFDADKNISVNSDNENIEEVLAKVFVQTENSYVIVDKQIFISQKAKQESEVTKSKSDQQGIKRITGIIKDNLGEALIGVSIVIKDKKKGTSSNIDGTYLLDVESTDILQFTYIGYMSQEVKVGDQDIININMVEDDRVLEEVVVVGFGVQKKESVIGAIQSIKTSDLKMPSTNLTNNFAGRVAGVISVQKSGEPGADGSSFWIRGVGTYAGGAAQTPLILIDGTESSSYDLNALAPEVIESFSILKDATATALYGSRGANGVMIVTTKSGKEGKPRINIRLEGRVSMPTQVPKLADGVTYMSMFNESILNRNPNGTPQFTDEQIEGVRNRANPYLYPDINWYDALFKDVSMSQVANLNVSGGIHKKMDYFISATFNNDSGMLRQAEQNPFSNNIQNMRYSFQANVNSYLSATTRIGVKINVQVQDYKGPRSSVNNLFDRVMWAQPSKFPIMFPQDPGSSIIKWGNESGGPQSNRFPNPYAEMAAGLTDRFVTTTMATFNFDQDFKFITPGLSFNGLFSLKQYSSTSSSKYVSPYYFEVDKNTIEQLPEGGYQFETKAVNNDGVNTATASNSYNGDRLLNLTLSVNYQRKFLEAHDISAQFIYLQRGVYKNNPSTSDYNASLGELNQGVAGRLTYDFNKRYFVEFNFGYNGSDNFMKGKKFGFFPSYAAGYIISNEEYFSSLTDVVSLLKLRGSYGEVGNSISSQRFPGYTHVNMGAGSFGFGERFERTKAGAIITRYGDPNATWEIARKANIGLELGLFNDKLLLVADVFQERRTQILTQRITVPSIIGIGNAAPFANIGKVNNKGLDLSLEYRHNFNKDLMVSVRGNMTFARNEVIFKDEPNYPWDYQYEKGGSLNRTGPAYVALGLFQDEDDIANSPSQDAIMLNVKPGDIKYKDMNNDGTIDVYDKTFVGNPYIPEIVYGFGFSAQYKKWDFSAFFQGVGNVSTYLDEIHPFGTYHKNVLGFVADDYWTESNPNPNAKYPRLSHTTDYENNQQTSTYWLRSGSFLRFKNIELGYSHRFFRVYMSGANLFTITPFKHWDPEIGGGSNRGNGLVYPLQRIFNLGMQFNF